MDAQPSSSMCRDGYKGLVLGYNSDAKAAEHARHELQDRYGATVFCVKVLLLVPCSLLIASITHSVDGPERHKTK